MEVIVTNVPFNLDAEGLHGALRRFMDPLGCFAYRCDKLFNRDRTNMHRCGVAKISLPSRELGAQFLRQHGDRAAAFGEFQALTQIRIGGRDLHIAEAMGPQNRPMDRYLMQSLQDTQRQMVIRRARRPRPRKRHELPLQREYPLLSFAVGAWNHDADGLVFVKHLLERRSCKVTFGRSDIRIRQFQGTGLPQFHLLVMPYAIVESITRDLSGPASITISLSEPPRVYVNDALMIGGQSVPQAGSESRNFKRVNGMDDLHAAIVSTCLVHRCFLEHGGDMEKVRSIEQIRALPRLIDIPSRLAEPSLGESLGITPLQQDISNYNLPFAIAFQIQKSTQYGHLQPHQLSKLIPTIASQVERKGAIYAEHALRDLNHTLPRAGPSMLEDDGYSQLSIEGIKAKLREAEYSGMDRYYAQSQLQDLHEQLCMIYKAVVTPTAVLLYGPELETKNRVLRIYEPYIEHFLRVQFRDESGEQMRGDAYVSLDEVYEQRFKGVLRDGITIADRHFEFLGFSHSSLRNQSCWFMAPFRLSDGQLMTARGVISELGDFSEMRIPAKCAARIGQAFSETIMSIDLDPRCLNKENDVEKKGRLFSDGVGTISTALWERIIAQRPEWQRLRPTVFQIRYAGAKGMVSLDTTLRGEQMRLRKSMIKFEGGRTSNLEICEAGVKPADLNLNRPLIKILEDLGVDDQVILGLQAKAIQDLRMVTQSPENAVTFLRREKIGLNAGLDLLLQMMKDLGVSYLKDPFLRDIVELSILAKLRLLKYKARIPVVQGVTLFGIMDETNYLRAGEIFVPSPARDSNGKGTGGIIKGRVLISRSPTMHPGDLQIATAITPPGDSPLRKLKHCVVFSQQGDRDLPSMLGGGDLDGDKYDIIYDPAFVLRIGAQSAAEYAPVSPRTLDRPVEVQDMTDFFVDFMRTDKLGLIATQHLIVAHQSPLGVRDMNCIKLAELHSHAVDFSKSGVPPSMDGLPWPKSKPDFMAPSPRILYEQGIRHDHDSGDEDDEHAAAVGETDEPDRGGRSFPYYESDKILGTLYRNIDERQFLEQIREGAQSINASPLGLVPEIWEMIEPKAAAEFDFRQYENDAMEIKQMYEDQVIDLMATYSTKPWSAKISEIEVVTGTILGKDGTKQSRQQEENSRTMKQRYDEIVDRTKEAILGPRGTRFDDPFQRTAACLAVAVAAPRKVQRLGYLRSFSWISVYMCLHEMERTSGRRVIEWGARAASEQRQDPEQPRSAAANAQSSQGSAEGSSQSTIREVKRAEQQENPVPIPEPPVGSEPVSIRSKKRELGGAYSHIPRSGRPSPATSSSRSSSARSTRSVRYGSSSASSRRSRTAPSPLSEPFSPLQEDSITSEAARISDEPSNSEAGHWPPSPSMQACLDQLELGLNLPDISLAIQMFEYNPRYRDSSGSAQDAKIKEQAKGARVGSRPSTNVKAHASASNDKASRPLNKPFKTQTHPSIRDLSHFESGVGERTIKQEDPAKPRTIPASSQVPTSKSWTSTVPAADSSTLPVRNSSRPAMITSQSLRNAVRGSNQHPIMIDEDTPLEELEELARWKAERTCIGWEVTKE